jgi:hypothetical protein
MICGNLAVLNINIMEHKLFIIYEASPFTNHLKILMNDYS